MNLYATVVRLENGWVGQVVYDAGRGESLQREPEIVWEADYTVETQQDALDEAKKALAAGARNLFKGVAR